MGQVTAKEMLELIPLHSAAKLGFSEVSVRLKYSVPRHNLGTFLAMCVDTGWTISSVQPFPMPAPFDMNLPGTYIVVLVRWAIEGDYGFGQQQP